MLRNHTVFENGTVRDTVVYSIIDGEWPTVRYALHERLGLPHDGAGADAAGGPR